MKKLLLSLLLAASFSVQAAPFLVSDPFPPADAAGASLALPLSCTYQEGTLTPVTEPVVVKADGSVYCLFDLASVPRAMHNYQVWTTNIWGVSVKVPFAFSASAPVAATGLQVTP